MVLNLLQAVYHMPTQEEEMPSTSIPLALQSTFYKVSSYMIRLISHFALQIDLQFDAHDMHVCFAAYLNF